MATIPMNNSTTNNNQDDGTNIQVCVRIRPNNDMEKRNKYQNVIYATSNTEIKIQSTQAITSTSLNQQQRADKTFTFDHVFGQQTTQAQVFEISAKPIIEQVLQGYNGAILCYGPSGSGKSHTIGTNYIAQANDPNMGIIQRCVDMIFTRLQQQGLEFSVKVSFIELYNEELLDLMSDDDSKQLRIYDDPKTGTMVQNLDELLITNCGDVFTLLQKAQQRRHTAQTNLNAQSSRSHTIFNITVHIKDVQDNEELYRSGTLRLVDLAGSENISKSGAVDQRQKEAGKINVSLLTLGRVITSLVQKNMSVPFRESKLTRLLRDSFTTSKTTIIATVSPSSLSADESSNTLDYAYRAKSIKNKPTMNGRITQKHYFRDLVNTIARLKAECAALRSKNGIYLPPEQYKELTDGYDAKCVELGETKQLMEQTKIEMAGKTVEQIATKDILDLVSQQYNKNTHHLLITRARLGQAKQELYHTQQLYHEEEYYSGKLQETEEKIAQQGKVILTTLDTVNTDNDLLFAKIERQKQQEIGNFEQIGNYKNNIVDGYDELCQIIDENNNVINKSHPLNNTQLKFHHDGLINATQAANKVLNEFNKDITVVMEQNTTEQQAQVDQLALNNQQFQQITTTTLQNHNENIKVMNKNTNDAIVTMNQTITSTIDNLHTNTNTHVNQQELMYQQYDAQSKAYNTEMTTKVGDFSKMITTQHNDTVATLNSYQNDQTTTHNHNIDQINSMLKHYTMYQGITSQQYNDLADKMNTDRVKLDDTIAQQRQHAKSSFDTNITHLNTTANIITQQNNGMANNAENIVSFNNEYNTKFKAQTDQHLSQLSSHHNTNTSFANQLQQTNLQWFDNYTTQIASIQMKQQQEFESAQKQQRNFKQQIAEFQTNMVNKLTTDSTQLLETMTTLFQTFVSTQQAEIINKTNEFIVGLDQQCTLHEESYKQNVKQYNQEIHSLHHQLSRNVEDNVSTYKQQENKHFSQNSQQLHTITTAHNEHSTALFENHIIPFQEQLKSNYDNNIAMNNKCIEDVTKNYNTTVSQLQSHQDVIATQNVTGVKMISGYSDVQMKANYPTIIATVEQYKSHEVQSNKQHQERFNNIITAQKQQYDVTQEHSDNVIDMTKLHLAKMNNTIASVHKQNNIYIDTIVKSNTTSAQKELNSQANALITQNDKNCDNLTTTISVDIIAPITSHTVQTGTTLNHLKTDLSKHHTTHVTKINDCINQSVQSNDKIATSTTGFTTTFATQLTQQTDAQLQYNDKITQKVQELTSQLEVLTTEQLQKYQPTGQTPMKRSLQYPTVLSRSMPKDYIVDQYRKEYSQNGGATIIEVDETNDDDTKDDNVNIDNAQNDQFNMSSFNLDVTMMVTDDTKPFVMNDAHINMITDVLQQQQSVEMDENGEPVLNLQPVEIDTNNITTKDYHQYTLLSTLPKSNLPLLTQTITEQINADITDEADNSAKTHTTTAVIDQNAKVAQHRAELLFNAGLLYADDTTTKNVVVNTIHHDNKIVNRDAITGYSACIMSNNDDGISQDITTNQTIVIDNDEETNPNTQMIEDIDSTPTEIEVYDNDQVSNDDLRDETSLDMDDTIIEDVDTISNLHIDTELPSPITPSLPTPIQTLSSPSQTLPQPQQQFKQATIPTPVPRQNTTTTLPTPTQRTPGGNIPTSSIGNNTTRQLHGSNITQTRPSMNSSLPTPTSRNTVISSNPPKSGLPTRTATSSATTGAARLTKVTGTQENASAATAASTRAKTSTTTSTGLPQRTVPGPTGSRIGTTRTNPSTTGPTQPTTRR